MSYKDLISDDFFFWLMCSGRFFHSAYKLEKVVKKAEKIWQEESAKLNLEPGVWKVIKSTIRSQNAEKDRSCHHVYPYLYCHSLELLFKGIMRAFSPEKNLCDFPSVFLIKYSPSDMPND